MFPKAPFGQQLAFSGFGQPQSQTTSVFGQTSTQSSSIFAPPSGGFTAPQGTTVKYKPTLILMHGQQTVMTKHCCISSMEEYANKSLEELRYEDYLANRKSRQQTAGVFGQAQAAPRPYSAPRAGAAPTGLFRAATEKKPLFGQPFNSIGFGAPSTGFGTMAQTGILFGQPSTVTATTPGFGLSAPTPVNPFGAAKTAEKRFGGMTADNKLSMGHSFTSTVAVAARCNSPSKQDEEEENTAEKSNSSPEAPGGSQVAKADAILLKLDQIANGKFELKGLLQGLSEATCKVKNSQPFIITENDWNYCLSKLSETVESVDKMKRYLRRNYLKIHGIPEEHNEDIYQIVIKVANSLGVQLCKDHLDEVYRLSMENAEFPQPIVVKFTNRWKRDEILAEKIRRKDLSTIDIGFSVKKYIYIYDHLQTS